MYCKTRDLAGFILQRDRGQPDLDALAYAQFKFQHTFVAMFGAEDNAGSSPALGLGPQIHQSLGVSKLANGFFVSNRIGLGQPIKHGEAPTVGVLYFCGWNLG